MTTGFLLQFLGSLVAVAALVALAYWLGKPRPFETISKTSIAALVEEEAPGFEITGLWIAADGQSAIARSGFQALMITRLGDGYVIRQAPWSVVLAAKFGGEGVLVRLRDDGAPLFSFAAPSGSNWPPEELL